jgi:hypothetical protein
MANTNTPTTLGNLEFNQIKQSLTDYLKSQSVFSGYNFEGSALQTIIDLMSYNTFYYAYYANMINAEAFLDSAQKEDSLISLCKPLGYTVPARTASKAYVIASALVNITDIPAGTQFTAVNESGINYSFYTLDKIPVDSEGKTDSFYIYEGTRYISFDALPSFDFDAQRITIAVDDFDLSTIQVTVSEKIDESTTIEQIWTPVGNVGYTSRIDENIYFVERTSTGFAILFGSANSVGRSIDSNIKKIIVRYLTTSGAGANNLSYFTSPSIGGVVTTVTQSSDGKSAPTPSEVRFIAPKWFAAQERAVTVNDYKALLLQSGYFASDKEFNVFGGQDLTPPKYGRVFVSCNFDITDSKVSELINFLKERSVVTVFPEYVTTNALNVYADFTFGLGPNTTNNATKRSTILSAVKSIFQSNYGAVGQFNVSFSATDFITTLRNNSNTDISTLIISPDNFKLYVEETLVSGKEYNFNLENELELPLNVPVNITEPFQSYLTAVGNKAILRMNVVSNSAKNNRINLQLVELNDSTGEVRIIPGDYGYFIANKGVINIKSGVIDNSALLTVSFAKKSFTIGLNNLITFTYKNVAIT